ncbi:SET domain-containing protein [Apiospora arundinis]
MSFQFVDSTKVGRNERRLIRSHVMKGKNTGKSLPPRKRHRGTTPVKRTLDTSIVSTTKGMDPRLMVYGETRILELISLYWSDLSLISFAHELTPESRPLIHQWFTFVSQAMYPPQFCQKYDLVGTLWFGLALQDEAYCHLMLAMAASMASFSLGESRLTPLIMTHLARTYQIINKRLSGPEALSDGSIAVVTSLAMHEDLHQQQSTAMVHFQGLRRMVELRGGMRHLFSVERHIGQKVWRLDIEFALHTGSDIHFHDNNIPSSVVIDGLRKDRRVYKRNHIPQWLCDTSTGLLDIALDAIDFTEFLNTRSIGNKLFALDYTDALLALTGSLLQVAPVAGKLPQGRDNLMHKSLLTYMVTFRPEYGRRLAKYNLLGRGLRSSAQAFRPSTAFDHELLLWALYCGGIQVFDESKDLDWLSSMVTRACEHLSLHTWAETRNVLRKVAWIPSVHDEAGETLWKSLGRSSQ